VWREEVATRTSEALQSLDPAEIDAEKRHETIRVDRVRGVLAIWDRNGREDAIDFRGDWIPVDYWILRRSLARYGGADAYHASRHWRETSSIQRKLVVFCERCGTMDRQLHAHHLHYESVGCERPCVDLMTLCITCHDKEHGF
jgi:hypothetical protein